MKQFRLFAILLSLGLFFSTPGAWAQFSGTVTGTVADPTGAVVPDASVQLVNDATGALTVGKTDPSGVFIFPSLAPGEYHLTCKVQGFSATTQDVVLQTNQVLNVPIKLLVGNAVQTVNVTAQSPLLDTADTRIQETISSATLSQLPLAGESMISLVTLSPGAVGTGVTSNGRAGSGRDNYATETQVDSSANGQGSVGNMYIIDGLDITSNLRAGVLNLTPSPDSIQETSIQTNTYSALYGRASSIEMTMTTKSGADHYHGNAEEIFTNQVLTAGTEFTHSYPPFHTNNISASIGGPVWPGKKLGYFFFEIEPQLASNALSETITFEDPAFTSFAQSNFPSTVGTNLLKTYQVSGISNRVVTSTAATVFPGTCGTTATANLPCSTAVIDTADYSPSEYRNGDQYFVRGDEDFKHDRLYGTVYRTTLSTNAPDQRAAFVETDKYYEWAAQANETHTFGANTINEASFGAGRVEGIAPNTGLFDVPVVNVTGISSGFGDGFAQGDFIQNSYHWRDLLTHVVKSHDIQFGFEGLFGTEIDAFGSVYDQPAFAFNNLLDLAEDNVYTESGLAYNPLTGKQDPGWDWNAAGATYGVFAQDTWKLGRRLTINYGLRWDDFGNPYSRNAETVISDFTLGPGQTYQQEVANGILVPRHHALVRSIDDVFSPRGGVAWDLEGNGKWKVKGGAGIFHNWPTLANVEEEFRGDPPGDIFPTFYGGQTPAPIFGAGTTNQAPYGFPHPVLPAESLNAAGGLTGLQFQIGAVDPTLQSPVTYIYSGGLEHELNSHYVAGISYSGANGRKLLSGGGQVYDTYFGQDINELPDDLIIHNSTVPTRLNTNFGVVLYTQNDRVSNYNAMILTFEGRFSRAFFNASYTRSSSWDDTQAYPSYIDVHQWYGPSNWNAPNRFSVAWNYQVPDYNGAKGFIGRTASGWIISGTGIFQSGYPFVVSTNAPFEPITNSSGQYVGYAPGSGDYAAEGDNLAYPNVSSYAQGTSRQAFLKGVFTSGQFPQPTFGDQGNELFNRFVGPNFMEWDTGLLKNTKITEGVNFQMRFEFFNLFNRPNLTSMDSNLPDASFGTATSQLTPRFIQIGGNLFF